LRRVAGLALAAGLLCLVVYLFPGLFLRPLGQYLVEADSPVRSDCLFVLAGDLRGQRLNTATRLYKEGYAHRIFVSGPCCMFGRTEDEHAIEYARRKGHTEIPFQGLPMEAESTVTEARSAYAKLREAGCRSVLAVTSDYHTRRAGRVLRRYWPDMQVRIVAAPSADYDAAHWWEHRRYQKTFLLEWTKTVTSWFGI
jgi:uncharacterized SAM-binding protein YcdF (DUF218 family)